MHTAYKNITIVGGGAWGTALAQMLAGQNRPATRVILYARDEGLATDINAHNENRKYLAGCALSRSLTAVSNLGAAVSEADMIVMATPAQFFAPTLAAVLHHAPTHAPIINTAKGIAVETGERPSEITQRLAPDRPFGVLSGPSFAHEVARGLPAALTLATRGVSLDAARAWAGVLSSPTFRPYLSDDVVGVEYGGALKNVIAIACGIVHGRKLGENARAAVMVRGMAEITRLAVANGAFEHTFLGLAGVGDLVLTCNSMASRNFSLGAAIGEGKTLHDIMQSRAGVAEGVATAQAVATQAAAQKIDMPISSAVNALLHSAAPLDDIISGLLARDLKIERE